MKRSPLNLRPLLDVRSAWNAKALGIVASGTPNMIATSFVTSAFLDAHELLGEERSGEAALSAARFLIDRMLARAEDGSYFWYFEREDELVHNASPLACAVSRGRRAV